ncbi:hypothetical protein WMB10_01835 [Tetragenococcus halophilus]|uniref:hypothetical protein n=1 Tax=Tetragenococcus halophilus TaxID=51669 RepID=UPI0030C98836
MQETKLEKLERLAYLKDEDPSFYDEWKRLRDKLYDDPEEDRYGAKRVGVCVLLQNGERKTFKSKSATEKGMKIDYHTLNTYLDSDKPVQGGKNKGCYFYTLEEGMPV